MGPCCSFQLQLFHFPCSFPGSTHFSLQEVCAFHVAPMADLSLARDSIRLLLVPNETPKTNHAPAVDSVTPCKVQRPFQINQFFEQNTKTLVKEICLARRVRLIPFGSPLRGQ
jgi:hypothetical protein